MCTCRRTKEEQGGRDGSEGERDLNATSMHARRCHAYAQGIGQDTWKEGESRDKWGGVGGEESGRERVGGEERVGVRVERAGVHVNDTPMCTVWGGGDEERAGGRRKWNRWGCHIDTHIDDTPVCTVQRGGGKERVGCGGGWVGRRGRGPSKGRTGRGATSTYVIVDDTVERSDMGMVRHIEAGRGIAVAVSVWWKKGGVQTSNNGGCEETQVEGKSEEGEC
ncbi:hypothetical protein BDQ17DRAFT_1336734 [Cyathus striatus]|nr:hypothetical protein BDQ17DRAFT_1336734 [Cyathus striatus]